MLRKKILYLVDGANYIFRAYYAIRALRTSKGFPTNAIYGFTQMLVRLLKDAKSEYLAVIFDTEEPTFRDRLYELYKANRGAPPDDLVPQFPYIPKIVDALNIPRLELPGFEADDLIGTLAKAAKAEGFEVVIVSGDKDLMQLVEEGVTLWDTMKEKHYSAAEVVERFGVPPEKVVDVLGLSGDSVDNIPGIPGVGPKTAIQLIQKYGSLEEVLARSEEISGKLGENIRTSKGQGRLSKQLVTIDRNVPIKVSPEELKIGSLDTEACHRLFQELEFSRLLAWLTPRQKVSPQGYQLIQDKATLWALVQKIAKPKRAIAIDLETDSLDVMRASPIGFSVSWAKGEAAYIPVRHVGLGIPKQIPPDEVLSQLKELLENSDIPKVGQNLKFDLAILKRLGLDVKNIYFDTMLASYLINPAGPHNLDALSQHYLDHKTTHYEEVVGKGAKQKPFSEVPLEVARDYSCEDADCTLRLSEIFSKELESQGLMPLYREIEMPLMEILLGMEMVGVRVDPQLLHRLSKEFHEKLGLLEKEIFDLAGGPFNIQSPKQLQEVLFKRLGLPGGRKTKTGFSTRESVLEELALRHPLPALILKYRSLAKLKSTYTDALVNEIHPGTGRIHTSFNQTVAETGRLSSSGPNLQNIPVRDEEGRKIRSAFIAEPGLVLLSADYSQIELRILAHYSEDPNLLQAFHHDVDIHLATAAGIFGKKIETVTKQERNVGKTINYALLYGQSAYGLASQLKKIPSEPCEREGELTQAPIIDPSEAKTYIESYFQRFPKVRVCRDQILEEAERKGFVTTLFGRRRFVPDLRSKDKNLRANAERTAFNTVFQGSAADLIKKAMVDIYKEMTLISPRARMILQVHDELLFEVPEDELKTLAQFVKQKMEGVCPLKAPLQVTLGHAQNWAEAH